MPDIRCPADTRLCSCSAPAKTAFPGQRRSAPHTPIVKARDDVGRPRHCCPGRADGDDEDQACARSRRDGAGAAANPAARTEAVMPTATAPMTENMICHASDSMRCLHDAVGRMEAGDRRRRAKAVATISFSHMSRTRLMSRCPAASVMAAATAPTRMAPEMPAPVPYAHAPAVTPTNPGTRRRPA